MLMESEKYPPKLKRGSRERTFESKYGRDRDRVHERQYRNEREGERGHRDRHERNERNYDSKSYNKDNKSNRDYAYHKSDRRRDEANDKTHNDDRNNDRYHRRETDRTGRHRDHETRSRQRYDVERDRKYERRDARRSRSPSTSQQNITERKRRHNSRSCSPTQHTKAHNEHKQILEKTRESEQIFNGKSSTSNSTSAESSVQRSTEQSSQPMNNALMNVLAANKDNANSTQLPKYYNPSVINPTKYAEQIQKRKLLWSGKKGEDNASKWGTAQFSQDSDGKVASKFMRLMGIKNSTGATETPTATTGDKSREDMFSSMEQQYEVARQATHTMRGVGLGFSSQSRLV